MEYIKYIICVAVILIIFYFTQLYNKNQNKKIKKIQEELKVGDKIITYSGIAGKIVEIYEDRIIVATLPNNTPISIEKWAVAGLDDRSIY